ncbi:MAG: hypothetical protein V7K25_00765 [Nostoc sp.]
MGIIIPSQIHQLAALKIFGSNVLSFTTMYRPMADNFRRYFFVSRYSLYTELILGCLQIQSGVICSVGIWTLSEAKLQAAQAHQTWKLPSELTERATFRQQEESTLKMPPYRLKPTPILMAAPENFNPDLQLPPALPEPPQNSNPPTTSTEPTQNSNPPTTSTEPRKPHAVLESIYTDYRYDTDNFGQTNLFFEPRIQFRLNNGNNIFIKTGFNFFEQRGVESVTNFPLQVGWQGKIGQTTLQTAVGVDVFNRLPTAINLNAKVEVPISRPRVSSSGQLLSAVVLSGNLEQGPYKSNARTLDNQITAWRFGPDLYWQIDRNTSLFSSLRLGSYNDGNAEVQSFSRLERKFGQFSLAANLFNWSFDRNLERTSGYFSPSDFLVYNAEVAWEGDISNFLRCRLAANLGQQRLQGQFDNAYTYQTRCTVKLSPNIETDLGYSFSNIRNQETGGSAYDGNSLTGQLRVKF